MPSSSFIIVVTVSAASGDDVIDVIDDSDIIIDPPPHRLSAHHPRRLAIASSMAILPFIGSWSNDNNNNNYNNIHNINTMSPTTASSSIIMHPPAAYALKERNEALCNTGFFTNVGAWYCTDIGNIGDEGLSKPLGDEAERSVDSLMSKFDLGGDIDVVGSDSGGRADGGSGRDDGSGEKRMVGEREAGSGAGTARQKFSKREWGELRVHVERHSILGDAQKKKLQMADTIILETLCPRCEPRIRVFSYHITGR
eukprot:CAMPEP_0181108730 /NCGR_PEP_ID=MMETSP1071-20121207/17789_1 /TAXON_ID=35127 /ORGANISM="Thalassiosira sp., Strain NH16" /LENGTH=253 /DNA_ID=CAMNT_0023192359 /DNA_START=58 /DNA_END=817 /DNA_ORIENTATION=+